MFASRYFSCKASRGTSGLGSCVFGLAVLAVPHGLNGSNSSSRPVTRPWGLAQTPPQKASRLHGRRRFLLSEVRAIGLVRNGRGALRVGQAEPGLQPRYGSGGCGIVDLPQGNSVFSPSCSRLLVLLGSYSVVS